VGEDGFPQRRDVHSSPRWRSFRSSDTVFADVLLAAVVSCVALASLVSRLSEVLEAESGNIRFRPPDAVGVGLLLVGTASITWRRRAPLLVLFVSCAAFFVEQVSGYATPPVPYAPLIAIYTVSVIWTPLRSAAVTGLVMVGIVYLFFNRNGPITDDQFLTYLISAGASWGLGYGVQLSRARTVLVEERAVQLAREQVTKTRLAVEQERARIARELHDIVAHNVSVIVAQSMAAQRVFTAQPALARQALSAIEASGRDALVEMRLLLGLLKPEPGTSEQRGPQPGLGQLAGLLSQIRRAGLPVELEVRGEPRSLPAAVELNAYRIVQEALTNTLRYAGPARARLLVAYDADVLRLRVRDDGRACSGDEKLVAGHGLVGMRERVALLGGTLAAGPRPEGGFEISVELPMDGGQP